MRLARSENPDTTFPLPFIALPFRRFLTFTACGILMIPHFPRYTAVLTVTFFHCFVLRFSFASQFALHYPLLLFFFFRHTVMFVPPYYTFFPGEENKPRKQKYNVFYMSANNQHSVHAALSGERVERLCLVCVVFTHIFTFRSAALGRASVSFARTRFTPVC